MNNNFYSKSVLKTLLNHSRIFDKSADCLNNNLPS